MLPIILHYDLFISTKHYVNLFVCYFLFYAQNLSGLCDLFEERLNHPRWIWSEVFDWFIISMLKTKFCFLKSGSSGRLKKHARPLTISGCMVHSYSSREWWVSAGLAERPLHFCEEIFRHQSELLLGSELSLNWNRFRSIFSKSRRISFEQ